MGGGAGGARSRIAEADICGAAVGRPLLIPRWNAPTLGASVKKTTDAMAEDAEMVSMALESLREHLRIVTKL